MYSNLSPEDRFIAQLIVFDPLTNHALNAGIFEHPYMALKEAQRIHQLDDEYTSFKIRYSKLNQLTWDLDNKDLVNGYFTIDPIPSNINLRPHKFSFDDSLIELTNNQINHDRILQGIAKRSQITNTKTKLEVTKDLKVYYTLTDTFDLKIYQINNFVIEPIIINIKELREQLRSWTSWLIFY